MCNKDKLILITGSAGFIGAAISKKLIMNGYSVIGIDNLNKYYDVNLKKNRLKDINLASKKHEGKWIFKKIDIVERKKLNKLFKKYKPKIVINLAAQAGVRYSLINPNSYIQSNILGFSNVLDACVENKVENIIYASSSSVYGGNQKLPYFEEDSVNHPVSLYAATKRSNELIAHSYSSNYGIPATGLRFFTVYGPFGRPDMAPMIFTKSILNGEHIEVYNFGKMKRDFTYIDDVVESIFRCCFKPATPDKEFDTFNPDASSSFAPHRIFNIGNSKPVELMKFVQLLEEKIGKKALINFKPLQNGDVIETFADINKLRDWINFSPSIPLKDGINIFVDWYFDFYSNKK